VFGIVMAGNGLLHLVGSIYMRKPMPGGAFGADHFGGGGLPARGVAL